MAESIPARSTRYRTVQDLIVCAELTDESIDKECSDEHLRVISCFLEKWELVSSFLCLERIHIEEIKHDSNNDLRLMRLKALLKWKSMFATDATYRVLLEALLRSGLTDQANQVCRLLNPNHGQVSTCSSPDSTSKQSELASFPLPSIPAKDSAKKMEKKIKDFERRFHDLQVTAASEVDSKGITIQTFRRTLTALPLNIKNEHKKFFRENCSLFEEANSIDSIFRHLNFYLSFIDFSLLEHIVKHFGSPRLQREMKIYSRDMSTFRMETVVNDVIPHLPLQSDSPQHYSKLSLKMNFNTATSSLEDVDQYRKKFASEFLLSEFMLFLTGMEKGSLLLVGLIPQALVSLLTHRIQKCDPAFFSQKLRIHEVCVSGKVIYPDQPSSLSTDSVCEQKLSSGFANLSSVSSWPGPNGTGTVASSPESVITHGKTMRGVDKGDPGLRFENQPFKLEWTLSRDKAFKKMFSPVDAVTHKNVAYFRPHRKDFVLSYNFTTKEWAQLPTCIADDTTLVIVRGTLTTVGGVKKQSELKDLSRKQGIRIEDLYSLRGCENTGVKQWQKISHQCQRSAAK